jgi:lipoprotein-anchoring transpeptidase ErfK/SrfK
VTRRGPRAWRGAARWWALLGAATLLPRVAAGGGLLPPWVAEGEVPPPAWARSVVARANDRGQPGNMVLFIGPSRASGRRGVTVDGASLPFLGQKRGSGCYGSWWLVGPLAWTCSDDAVLGAADPSAPERMVGADGLFASYSFVRSETASAYSSIESAQAGEASEELSNGWSVAIVQELTSEGAPWARTTKGLYIARADLTPARPSRFRGEVLADGHLDFAWVVADRAPVWPTPAAKGKTKETRARFQRLAVREESGAMLRVDDGAWVAARDVARPRLSAPPPEVTRAGDRWIDVDLAAQVLVAYVGTRPVFATLVSTGRGEGDTVTRTGVHRIWVKLISSDMSNIERDDGTTHYSMQDVPYVQFFDEGIALHGTYWHDDFGHTHSHGCVNLAPLDARWLFDFTGPRLPIGWTAAYPTSADEGTVIQVR